MVQVLCKTVWQFLKGLNIELPYDLPIPLLGMYSREMKTCPHKTLNTDVHSSITVTAKKRKQPKYPSADE